MILMNVVRDDAMAVLGFERHTFRCSACHETERRLVFINHGRETEVRTLATASGTACRTGFSGSGWTGDCSRSL
jgi:hypothetical protein